MAVDIDPRKVAEIIKEEGNEYFKKKEYQKACDKYTEGIDICPTAILYANRSFCYLKMECCGMAIRDADKAIELDPSYGKGHGASSLKSKVAEVAKIVKAKRFEEAIHVTTASYADQVVLKDLNFPKEVEGPAIDYVNNGDDVDDYTITERFIMDMMKWHQAGKKLHPKYVYIILIKAIRYFRTLPNIIDLHLSEGEKNTFRVCGDVHGQYYDFINIFNTFGYPSASAPYLFNGDFTDRGSFSVEIALTAFCYKLAKPDCFFLLRGNHESPINKMFGFEGEVKAKYNSNILQLFSECFRALPLAAVLENHTLILHGGLFKQDGVTLQDINKIDRFTDCMNGLLEDILWSDPMDGTGRQPSRREAGTMFGQDVTERFLKENNLKLLVRSHEVKMGGYEVQHGGKCITIFSAPNYCDTTGNVGALIMFDHNMVPTFKTFEAVPHPPPNAMYYAPKMF
ncbi:serine/threonine-protein phosphatase [Blastocystis sp. ATCC 50177/Nand II]|uniref:Serine/threonine-protein phosphatase n=1 Tax=Blastocystis sp. subtype 1 (strain ATCC 50177 / NandII) TaxID=478820 RepID=A0A196SI85_BLAHN|nr:serine/threonine-protein phosphatase [Blastocystis sp. ATCC 50177/Nand II]